MTVPDGAQRSEDGYYWLDGGDWKPVPEDDPRHPSKGAAADAATSAAAAAATAAPGAAADAATSAAAGAATAATSGDPLDDEQVKHAVTHGYPDVVEYGDTHGAELSADPDPGAGEHEAGEHDHEEA
jgi:hypothetical protein